MESGPSGWPARERRNVHCGAEGGRRVRVTSCHCPRVRAWVLRVLCQAAGKVGRASSWALGVDARPAVLGRRGVKEMCWAKGVGGIRHGCGVVVARQGSLRGAHRRTVAHEMAGVAAAGARARETNTASRLPARQPDRERRRRPACAFDCWRRGGGGEQVARAKPDIGVPCTWAPRGK